MNPADCHRKYHWYIYTDSKGNSDLYCELQLSLCVPQLLLGKVTATGYGNASITFKAGLVVCLFINITLK